MPETVEAVAEIVTGGDAQGVGLVTEGETATEETGAEVAVVTVIEGDAEADRDLFHVPALALTPQVIGIKAESAEETASVTIVTKTVAAIEIETATETVRETDVANVLTAEEETGTEETADVEVVNVAGSPPVTKIRKKQKVRKRRDPKDPTVAKKKMVRNATKANLRTRSRKAMLK